jgi:DNA-binding transcriptional LysR family regulator
VRDLSEQAWVVNTSGCGYRDALARAFDRSQARMKVSAEVLGYELQLSVIARGAGLGLVPLRRLNASTYRRQLRALQLEDFKLEADVAVLRRSSLGSLGPAVDYLAECLSEHLAHAKDGA